MKFRHWISVLLLLASAMLIARRVALHSTSALSETKSTTRRASSGANKPGFRRSTGRLARAQRSAVPSRHKGAPTEAAAVSTPKTRRLLDEKFLQNLRALSVGDAVQLQLLGAEHASGNITRMATNGLYIAGTLSQPAPGRFFFQTQTIPGVAGKFVGVLEFPSSNRAFRLEPSENGTGTDLVEHDLAEVVCYRLPAPKPQSNLIENIPPLKPGDFPDLPIPDYQNGVAVLQSLPGATAVLYLDFQGGYTPTWGGVAYARPDVGNAQIRDVWVRVAEDYMPFRINVTTDLGVYQRAPENSRQRVIITPTDAVSPGAGGAAYLGSFNWTGDTPCWVFTTSGKPCAEACSHEAGHTFGLEHSGQWVNGLLTEYYQGQGAGDLGWAPIMGIGYYRNVVQWSKGEYQGASNPQDALAIISGQNNNVGFRADDTGDRLPSSRYLELYSDFTASAEGVIERTDDSDAFEFTTSGGTVSLRADPVSPGPNLAVNLSLYDALDHVIASVNPTDTLWASLTTNVPPGTYTFRVSGAGRNDPLTDGFSSYGSLGYYSITGLVQAARLPNRFSISSLSKNGTFVGIVPANNPNSDPLRFRIASGNQSNTFAIDDAGVLAVADNHLLDYTTLANQSQFPVQFELFVNITNLAEPLQTELGRRVVVAVTYTPSVPVILDQPRSVSVPAGTNVTLFVRVVGAVPYDPVPFAYEWTFNGSPLPGASLSSLILTNVQSEDAGPYQVVITNVMGACTSEVAALTVISAPPYITRNPKSGGLPSGGSVTLFAAATGTEPLSSQWQFQGSDISSATNTFLTLADFSAEKAGVYRCVFSSPAGTTSTSNSVLQLVPVFACGASDPAPILLPLELTNAVQIAAGSNFSLALRRDGTIVSWGNSPGTNSTSNFHNLIGLAAGPNYGLGLGDSGRVIGWGDNSDGQLWIPLYLTNAIAIAAGGAQCLALRPDGTVSGWGSRGTGVTNLPPGLTNIIAIATGGQHSLALKASGTVMAWGDNTFGHCRVPNGLADVVALAAGRYHSVALRADGTIVSWGANDHGQCTVPAGLSNVTGIAAGDYHSLALRADGTVVAWGAGRTNSSTYPDSGQCLLPENLSNVTTVAAGAAHTLALLADGPPFILGQMPSVFTYSGHHVVFHVQATGALPLAYQWQSNGTNLPGATNAFLVLDSPQETANYRLLVSNSFGTASSSDARLTVARVPAWIVSQPQGQTVNYGSLLQMQVQVDGSGPFFYQWSFNGVGIPRATNSVLTFERAHLEQEGDYSVLVSTPLGNVTSSVASVTVRQVVAWGKGSLQTNVPAHLNHVIKFATGGAHNLALKEDGTVVSWGADTFGQTTIPPGLTGVIDIAAGTYHSLALKSDGTVVAWGAGTNDEGGLHSNFGQAMVPPYLSDVVQISAGAYESFALTKDGRLISWGSPYEQVSGVTNLVAMTKGNLGLADDGNVVRWALTNGIYTVDIPSSFRNNFHAVAMNSPRYPSTCLALRDDGNVLSWGGDYPGPPSSAQNVVEIATASYPSIARKSDGTIVNWGLFHSTFPPDIYAPHPDLTNCIAVGAGDSWLLTAFGDGSPVITLPPADRAVLVGSNTMFCAITAGADVLKHQWLWNGAPLARATNSWLRLSNVQPENAGVYQIVVSNSMNVITSTPASLEIRIPLEQALGSAGLPWSQGPVPWYGQLAVTRNGQPTAQTGKTRDNVQSYLQTSMIGPGTLTFWWKVSSDEGRDWLTFLLDDTPVASISGEVDWQQQVQAVPPGPHVVRITYAKDASGSAGQDAGWVSGFVWLPDPPIITSQPQGGTIPMGRSFGMSVAVAGSGWPSYQWLKDGTNLPGENSPLLFFYRPTRRDSGVYSVVVNDNGASVVSSNATLRVLVPQLLRDAAFLPDGTFRFLSGDADGGALQPSDLPGFEPQFSSNFVDWIPLQVSLDLTNGMLRFTAPQSTNSPVRFYRILEH